MNDRWRTVAVPWLVAIISGGSITLRHFFGDTAAVLVVTLVATTAYLAATATRGKPS